MSDSRVNQTRLPEEKAEPPAPAAVTHAAQVNGSRQTQDIDLSDNAPTIISRSPRQPVRPEDLFANTLRGRRLAHYELIEPIGVGGMAAVIHARTASVAG